LNIRNVAQYSFYDFYADIWGFIRPLTTNKLLMIQWKSSLSQNHKKPFALSWGFLLGLLFGYIHAI